MACKSVVLKRKPPHHCNPLRRTSRNLHSRKRLPSRLSPQPSKQIPCSLDPAGLPEPWVHFLRPPSIRYPQEYSPDLPFPWHLSSPLEERPFYNPPPPLCQCKASPWLPWEMRHWFLHPPPTLFLPANRDMFLLPPLRWELPAQCLRPWVASRQAFGALVSLLPPPPSNRSIRLQRGTFCPTVSHPS